MDLNQAFILTLSIGNNMAKLEIPPGGGGAHLNISVVHMCDQRFSTYPNHDFPSPGKTAPKLEFHVILPQMYP